MQPRRTEPHKKASWSRRRQRFATLHRPTQQRHGLFWYTTPLIAPSRGGNRPPDKPWTSGAMMFQQCSLTHAVQTIMYACTLLLQRHHHTAQRACSTQATPAGSATCCHRRRARSAAWSGSATLSHRSLTQAARAPAQYDKSPGHVHTRSATPAGPCPSLRKTQRPPPVSRGLLAYWPRRRACAQLAPAPAHSTHTNTRALHQRTPRVQHRLTLRCQPCPGTL